MDNFENKVRYYLDMLAIPFDADFDESDILNNYRMLSKIYHPDKQKVSNGDRKFIEITEAKDFILNNFSKIKSFQNIKKNSNNNYADQTVYQHEKKEIIAFKLNKVNVGIISIIIGAIIHFLSSLFGMLTDIIVVNYLATDQASGEVIFNIWNFFNKVSFLGNIFYFIGFYILFYLISNKLLLTNKVIFYLILGFTILVDVVFEIIYNAGVGKVIFEIFLLTSSFLNIVLCIYFLVLVKKLNKETLHEKKYIYPFIAFFIDLILTIIVIVLYFLQIEQIIYYSISIFINLFYIIANICFIIFAIYFLQDKEKVCN